MLFPAPIELLACNLSSCLWDEEKKVAVKGEQAWHQLVKYSSTRRPFMTFKASGRSGKEKHILIQRSHARCDHSDFTCYSVAWTCTRPKLLAVLWNECVHNWHFEDPSGKVHLGYIHKADSAWYWGLLWPLSSLSMKNLQWCFGADARRARRAENLVENW